MAILLDEKGNPMASSKPEPEVKFEPNYKEELVMSQFIVYMSRVTSEALVGTSVKEIVQGFFDGLEEEGKKELILQQEVEENVRKNEVD
jgi:hypothetical protein